MKSFRKLINLPRKFGINANKIELSANDVLNLLAGNTINLKSRNILISSDAFHTDKNGKVYITGDRSTNDLFRVETASKDEFTYVQPVGIGIVGSGGRVDISAECARFDNSSISVSDTHGNSEMRGNGITTPKLTQTSLKSKKKNIKKLDVDAIDLVKNADICEYNFKSEKEGSKKHIGLVIGEGYNCPDIVVSEDGQGVEQYSLTSLLWKAVQELTEKVERLEEKLNEQS